MIADHIAIHAVGPVATGHTLSDIGSGRGRATRCALPSVRSASAPRRTCRYWWGLEGGHPLALRVPVAIAEALSQAKRL
jgi:hypothetical protein